MISDFLNLVKMAGLGLLALVVLVFVVTCVRLEINKRRRPAPIRTEAEQARLDKLAAGTPARNDGGR